MATQKQRAAARTNIKRAQRAAAEKRTIANLPSSTRTALGQQGAQARRRGGKAGHRLEDRTRAQLYELAQKRNVPGRSRMGKAELITALRRG